ncbi:hypothetical protein P3W23_14180 [Luteibacter sp. PPL554]
MHTKKTRGTYTFYLPMPQAPGSVSRRGVERIDAVVLEAARDMMACRLRANDLGGSASMVLDGVPFTSKDVLMSESYYADVKSHRFVIKDDAAQRRIIIENTGRSRGRVESGTYAISVFEGGGETKPDGHFTAIFMAMEETDDGMRFVVSVGYQGSIEFEFSGGRSWAQGRFRFDTKAEDDLPIFHRFTDGTFSLPNYDIPEPPRHR